MTQNLLQFGTEGQSRAPNYFFFGGLKEGFIWKLCIIELKFKRQSLHQIKTLCEIDLEEARDELPVGRRYF
jgi:hypothetical protein